MERIKIGFIGAGNMAGAIIGGLRKADKLPASQIGVYDLNEDQTAKYRGAGHTVFQSVPDLAAGCEYVVLAVKPQTFSAVLPQLKEGIQPDTVVVSIAAGISPARIREGVGFDCKVVLVGPNTPLLLGAGSTVLFRIEPISDEEFDFVRELFAQSGVVAEILEDKRNQVIPVNGSSPAFIYRFAQVICEYAAGQGIPEETAMKLFAQTLIGSARMLTETGKSPQELIDMVCSPGGTTLAALEAMKEHGFEKAILAGCEACLRRAGELAEEV